MFKRISSINTFLDNNTLQVKLLCAMLGFLPFILKNISKLKPQDFQTHICIILQYHIEVSDKKFVYLSNNKYKKTSQAYTLVHVTFYEILYS